MDWLDRVNENHQLAKVRVAGSNPVVRSNVMSRDIVNDRTFVEGSVVRVFGSLSSPFDGGASYVVGGLRRSRSRRGVRTPMSVRMDERPCGGEVED